MNEEYIARIPVYPSLVDVSGRLGLVGALAVLQDVTAMHSALMGTDGPTILKTDGVIWVVTKTVIEILRMPDMLEPVTVKTWPQTPSGVRCLRSHLVTDEANQPLIRAVSEWVLLGVEDRRLRRPLTISSIKSDGYNSESAVERGFSVIRPKLESGSAVLTHRACASDLDTSRHINNVRFGSVLLSAATAADIETPAKSFEIHYVKEGKPGQLLSITRNPTDNGVVFGAFSEEGELICTAEITFA